MKELKNNVNTEVVFTKLEEAKEWYMPKDNIPCTKDEYLGDDYEGFCKEFTEYKKEIEQSQTLVELANVLNKYTDTFQDGSEELICTY